MPTIDELALLQALVVMCIAIFFARSTFGGSVVFAFPILLPAIGLMYLYDLLFLDLSQAEVFQNWWAFVQLSCVFWLWTGAILFLVRRAYPSP